METGSETPVPGLWFVGMMILLSDSLVRQPGAQGWRQGSMFACFHGGTGRGGIGHGR